MKHYLLAGLLALACAVPALAQGATLSITVTVVSPPSTTVTCPVAGPFTAPVAPGTTICTYAVAPAGWQGAVALSGTNASSFTFSGNNFVVGPTALGVGSYSVTLTATP